MSEQVRFKVGDRVQLTPAALKEFPEYRENPYGVVLTVEWVGGTIRTREGEEMWDFRWWELAPEPAPYSAAWLHERAMAAAFARE